MSKQLNTYDQRVSADQALLWLEFDGSYTDGAGNRVIKNYGRYPGAPATVKCGDGTTASTFPTQLSTGKGMSFDGGDWIDTGIVDAFERTDKFTLVYVGTATGLGTMIGTRDVAQDTRGIEMDLTPTGIAYARMYENSSTSRTAINNNLTGRNTILHSYAMVVSGPTASGINLYTLPSPGIQSVSIDLLSGSVLNGKSFLIGARHNGINKTNFITGTTYFCAIFPFELTPQQVASLDHYVRARINNSGAKQVSPDQALLWLEMENQYTNGAGKRVIKNYGRYPGAPLTVQCGDGVTSTTFPTQLVGKKGLSFDGGDYIDTGIVDPFERTDKFTLFVVSSGITAVGSLISSQDNSNALRGITLSLQANFAVLYLINDFGGAKVCISVNTPSGYPVKTVINSLCYTFNGSSVAAGVLPYLNGTAVTPSIVYNNLTATIKNGKSFLIGAGHNGAAKLPSLTGNLHFAAIFPYKLNPSQVSTLHRYVLSRINQ